jgi:hypothetical protein
MYGLRAAQGGYGEQYGRGSEYEPEKAYASAQGKERAKSEQPCRCLLEPPRMCAFDDVCVQDDSRQHMTTPVN